MTDRPSIVCTILEAVLSAISSEETAPQSPRWVPPLREVIVQEVPAPLKFHPSRFSNNGAKAPYIDR
jgi:hypothetical protein